MANASDMPETVAGFVQDYAGWRDENRQRDVPIIIFAPDRESPANGFPVVVFSPGFGESHDSYTYLGKQLASSGFITVIVDHIGSNRDALNTMGWSSMSNPEMFLSRPADLSFVIDRIVANDQPHPLLKHRVDASKIGVAGHSLGSTTALTLMGLSVNVAGSTVPGYRDQRVRAAVVLSPQIDSSSGYNRKTGLLDETSWDSVKGPVLLMTGTRDFGLSRATRQDPAARRVVYERLKHGDTYYITIDDAAHHAFTDTPPYYMAAPRDPRHHDWIGAAVTNFFDAYLNENADSLQWMKSGAIHGYTQGRVVQEYKSGGRQQQEVAKQLDTDNAAYDLQSLTAFIEQGLGDRKVKDAGILILDRDGNAIYEKFIGNWSMDKAVPVASASKWWAAATIMTLVDQGLLGLDDPVSKYLPEFRNKGSKSDISIRQTLSFTAGYAHHHPIQDNPAITQAELVRKVADMELKKEPGTAFIYGGLQMEIAGRIAEVVTGKPYRQVFEDNILKPLGADSTKIGNLVNRSPRNIDFESENPLVPGGVVTSMEDFSKFILMLLNDGVYEGKRILSSAAVSEMKRDQTAGAPIIRTAQEDESYRYSLGAWHRIIDASQDEVIVSSSGALGTSPWINTRGEYGVVFMTLVKPGQVRDFIWRLKDAVTDVMNGRRLTAELPRPAVSHGGISGRTGIEHAFTKLDRNNDGELNRDEIPRHMVRLHKAFDKLDRDNTGGLSRDDLAVVSAFAGRGSARQATGADELAARKNITRQPVEGAPRQLPGDIYKAVDNKLEIGVHELLTLDDVDRGKKIQLRITYPLTGNNYPVIIFSHYSGGTRNDYASLIEHWARNGYICIQPDHSDSPAVGGRRGIEARRDWANRPRDIAFIIDSLTAISNSIPALEGRMDTSRIGVGGHYLGAFTANLLGGMKLSGADSDSDLKDDRVTAIVAISPQGTGEGVTEDSWRELHIPMLVMTGAGDVSARTGNSAQWRTEPYIYSPPGDKYMAYVNDRNDDEDGWSGARFLPIETHIEYTRVSTTAFWDAYLKGSLAAKQFLREGVLERESQGRIELEWK